MMYGNLVRWLRNCATQAAPCKNCEMIVDACCTDTLMEQAADAIEELVCYAELYKNLTGKLLEIYTDQTRRIRWERAEKDCTSCYYGNYPFDSEPCRSCYRDGKMSGWISAMLDEEGE